MHKPTDQHRDGIIIPGDITDYWCEKHLIRWIATGEAICPVCSGRGKVEDYKLISEEFKMPCGKKLSMLYEKKKRKPKKGKK